jgi:hypothetical protein
MMKENRCQVVAARSGDLSPTGSVCYGTTDGGGRKQERSAEWSAVIPYAPYGKKTDFPRIQPAKRRQSVSQAKERRV